MRKIYFLLLALCMNAYSQNPADIDFTYDTKDYKSFFDGAIDQVVVQPDGKILVLWKQDLKYYGGDQRIKGKKLVRLNADMTLDESFIIGFKGTIYQIALQSTGKIILIGMSLHDGSAFPPTFIRLNIDGSLDPTFASMTYPTERTNKIAVQADDKILLSGHQSMYGNTVIRYDANGGIDTTFTTIQNSGDLQLYSDGKIIISRHNHISRYHPNGSPDTTFQPVVFDCSIIKIKPLPDNKMFVIGDFRMAGGLRRDNIVRLNANGSVDTSFNLFLVDPYYALCGQSLYDAVTQPDGKTIVGGYFTTYNGAAAASLIRINVDGTRDTTFNSEMSYAEVTNLTLQSNGDVVIGLLGHDSVGQRLAKYNGFTVDAMIKVDTNGKLLETPRSSHFPAVKIVDGPANTKLLLGSSTIPGHRGIKLINNNGQLVQNDNFFSGFNNGICRTAAIQPNGKIIVGGTFTSYNGIAKNGLIRLNADYSIDETFQPGTNLDSAMSKGVNHIDIQPDGKIIISTDAYRSDGTLILFRLHANGEWDSSFVYDGTVEVNKFFLLPDGKILVGNRRLNTNGSNDVSYAAEIGFSPLIIQNDGKILGISKTNYKISRLNSDGTSDATFFSISISVNDVAAMDLQADGKIIVVGGFSGVTDSQYHMSRSIVRLNSDGTFDPTFDAGTGFSMMSYLEGRLKDVKVLADGKIFVVGEFSRYNGFWCNGSVRLLGGDAFAMYGESRLDSNANGCDNTDVFYPNMKLHVTSSSADFYFIGDVNGKYTIPFPPGSYTVTPVFENPTYQNVSPASVSVTLSQQQRVVEQNFCVSVNSDYADMEVTIIPVEVARAGFDATYKVIYKNKGNRPLSGTVALTYEDAFIDYVSAEPLPATNVPGNLMWNFTNLAPFQTREVTVKFNLNGPMETPALNGGSRLVFDALVTIPQTDAIPSDNRFILHQGVVNSYDPNDKTCLEGTSVNVDKIGDYMHYMIRFENTGNWAAQNITVTDIIDTDKFDIASLIPIKGSHSFVTKITGNKVDFMFNNINLPFEDARNDGYVSFKIKIKSNLQNGDAFSNTASIYFDYNFPIVTNTATTTISTLATTDFAFENYFTIYPNPAVDYLTVHNKKNITLESVEIYNISGQRVLVVPNANGLEKFDVSQLKTGSYFLKIHSEKGSSNIQFLKK